MAYAQVSVGAVSAGFSAVRTVNYPATINSGNLLILFCQKVAGGLSFTPSDITTSLASQGTNMTQEIFGKIATGSESGTFTVTSSGTSYHTCQAYCYSGGPATLAGIVHASNTNTSGGETGLTHPSLTVTVDNTLKFLFSGKFEGDPAVGAISTPSGFTEETDHSGGTNAAQTQIASLIDTTATNITGANLTVASDQTRKTSSIAMSLLSGSQNTTIEVPKGPWR